MTTTLQSQRRTEIYKKYVIARIEKPVYKFYLFFFLNDTPPTEISPLPQHDPLPIKKRERPRKRSPKNKKTTATDSTLTTACLASCQKLLTQIENTKDNIVAEFRHLLEAHEQL